MSLVKAACLLATLWIGAGSAQAETIVQLVSREEGVDFGPCVLEPPLQTKGVIVHAVIPARFKNPGIWSTRSLLLVGVDANGVVQDQKELLLSADVPPREVLKVRCSGKRLEIHLSRQASGKILKHRWNGHTLAPVSGQGL